MPTVLGATLWIAVSAKNGVTAERDRRSVEPQEAADKRAPATAAAFNIRPMRLSSGSRSPLGEVRRLRSETYSGSARPASQTTDDAAEQQQRQLSAYAPANDEGGALFDAGRKVVLPSDVAGACNIGGGGIKDLGACLLQNGARAR